MGERQISGFDAEGASQQTMRIPGVGVEDGWHDDELLVSGLQTEVQVGPGTIIKTKILYRINTSTKTLREANLMLFHGHNELGDELWENVDDLDLGALTAEVLTEDFGDGVEMSTLLLTPNPELASRQADLETLGSPQ